MKRNFALAVFSVAVVSLLFGCAQKNPLDLTPDKFIEQFDAAYTVEFPENKAVRLDPITENNITVYRYKISSQGGFMFTVNDYGNIEIGTISSSEPLELIAMQLLSYEILHGSDGLKVYDAMLGRPENDPLIYSGVTHARLPYDGFFQCVGFSR